MLQILFTSALQQAGRYIADFRKYSEKYPFRQRSETPEIAIELSLQPWRKFGVDGVIMFSGIQHIDFVIIAMTMNAVGHIEVLS